MYNIMAGRTLSKTRQIQSNLKWEFLRELNERTIERTIQWQCELYLIFATIEMEKNVENIWILDAKRRRKLDVESWFDEFFYFF